MVAEDENGDGLVVQIILPLVQMEGLALARACELDGSADRLERSREAGVAERFLERTGFVLGQMAGHQDALGAGGECDFREGG